MSALADELRRRRRRLGHAQEDAARAIGVSQQSIGRWEKGESPDWKQAPAIAEYLQISHEEADDLIADAKRRVDPTQERLELLAVDMNRLTLDANRIVKELIELRQEVQELTAPTRLIADFNATRRRDADIAEELVELLSDFRQSIPAVLRALDRLDHPPEIDAR